MADPAAAPKDPATIPTDYPDPIPGDFVLMYTVENLGQAGDPAATPPVPGETETRIGYVNDDIELSPDYDDEETAIKEDGLTRRTPGHHTKDLTFNIRARTGEPNIQALDVVNEDANGNLEYKDHSDPVECTRFYTYSASPGANATLLQVREIENVTYRFDDDTMPEGEHSNYDIMGYVNGTVRWGKTPTA